MLATTKHALAVVLALLLAIAFAHAQEYNVPFNPPAAGGGGTCATSPNLSNVLYAFNWQKASCAGSRTTAYTTELDTGDYPDALAMTYNTPASGDVNGLLDAFTMNPLGADDCVVDVDYDTTQNGGPIGFSAASLTRAGATASVYAEIHVDVAESATDTTPRLVSYENTSSDHIISFRVPSTGTPDGDIACTVEDSASLAVTVTSSGDTDCCVPGTYGGCNLLFQDGEYAATKVVSVECVVDSSGASDFVRLYVDGCMVDEDTTALSNTTDYGGNLYIGDAHTNNQGRYYIGRVMVSDAAEILSLMVTGETTADSDLSDGNECWCRDAGGGTDCDG